ncbi:MAG TPA: ankyrin repeat domain-containing protein [Verrucomicrobiota bacterium]|nr:ankyrin repeat domain-containing protein [Verrucomicrobiota bacterium]
MKTLFICGIMLLQWNSLRGADSAQAALQRGLTAEEAQRDLAAARDAYSEAIRLAEAQREAAATALYRLSEVQRRLGDTNAATEAIGRLLRDYPEQTNLVVLVRQGPSAPAQLTTRVTMLNRDIELLEAQAGNLEKVTREAGALSDVDRARRLSVDHATPELSRLLTELNQADVALSQVNTDFGPKHPERLRAQTKLDKLSTQLSAESAAILSALDSKWQGLIRESANLAGKAKALSLQLEQEAQNPANRRSLGDDPNVFLQEEITLAEEQLRMVEVRFRSGQASQDEVIRARRDVLSLKRQLASQNRRPDIVELSVPDPTLAPQSPAPERDEEAVELARLHKLAAESPDLLLRAGDNGTPLQRAARKGWTNAIVYLLDLGVPPDSAPTDDRATALHIAARAGDLPLAALLLNRGANVNSLGNSNETPLHAAVRSGHRAMAELLIERGADLNARTLIPRGMGTSGWESEVYSNTPLHLGVYYGAPALVELLLSRGAMVDVDNHREETPLSLAITRSRPELVPRLLAAGANPNQQFQWLDNPSRPRTTPVLAALTKGDLKSLRALLQAGASPRFSAEEGRTPLHQAVYHRQADAIAALLEAGADVNAKDWAGRTPLDGSNDPQGEVALKLKSAGGTNSFRAAANAQLADPETVLPNVRRGGPPPVIGRGGVVLDRSVVNSDARFYGEVTGVVPLTNGVARRLREALTTLSPSANADLSRILLSRPIANSGPSSLNRTNLTFDLTLPENDPELQPGDIVYLTPRPAAKRPNPVGPASN